MTHIQFIPRDSEIKPAISEAVRLAKHHKMVVLFEAAGVKLKVWPNSTELEVWGDFCQRQGFIDTMDISKLREYLQSDKFKEGELQGYVHIQDVLNRLGG